MKLDEILSEIKSDSVIDKANLDDEAIKIPRLHSKYYTIFLTELRILRGLDYNLKCTKRERIQYYTGKLDDQAYIDEPLNHKVMKADVDVYLDADEKLARAKAQYDAQKSKVQLVEDFIKALNNRSFLISNAINWAKFQAGA